MRSIEGWKSKSNWSRVFTHGQPGQLEPALDAALMAAAPLGFEGLGEEALVVQVALGGVLADAVELGQQVLHLHPLEEGGQFHVATSS